MSQKHCKWYPFLQSVRGNWRNAIFIDCAGCPRHSCPGFLLTADAEGKLLLLPVDEFQQFSGQQVEKEECRGILSRQAFEAVFSLYLEWLTPSAQDCGLHQLCAKNRDNGCFTP